MDGWIDHIVNKLSFGSKGFDEVIFLLLVQFQFLHFWHHKVQCAHKLLLCEMQKRNIRQNNDPSEFITLEGRSRHKDPGDWKKDAKLWFVSRIHSSLGMDDTGELARHGQHCMNRITTWVVLTRTVRRYEYSSRSDQIWRQGTPLFDQKWPVTKRMDRIEGTWRLNGA